MSYRNMRVQMDNYTRFCLGATAVLLTVLILSLWATQPVALRADAGEMFADAAAERKSMIEEQKETNKKLDELIALLKSGEAKMQVQDKKVDEDGGEK